MSDQYDLYSDFRERFQLVTDPAYMRAERRVTGGDYGAASYTTMAQADGLAERLGLTTDTLLLDIGSGAGWPANYLTASTGCTTILSDPTLEGMAVASDRSHRDRLSSHAVVADGVALPFRDSMFDAATSSDVFC